MPQDRYQTVQDVADRMKVSEATVRHWIKEGGLRAIDIGKGWRISDADLRDFLRRHETRPREIGPLPCYTAEEISNSEQSEVQEH